MIKFKNVTVIYPKKNLFTAKSKALSQVSFTVSAGKTVGIIGPNGAGKTTSISLLLGLIKPTTGQVTILSQAASTLANKKLLGYLPERPYFYQELTGAESLHHSAQLYGFSGKKISARINFLLEKVGLQDARNKQVRQYSKGMQQRLGIAAAMLHEPKILLLDEPMSGLDPLGRHQMCQFIQELQSQHTTILFCSHILTDVQALCDEVVILKQGELIAQGVLNELLPNYQQSFELVVDGICPGDLEQIARKVHQSEQATTLQVENSQQLGQTLHLIDKNPASTVASIKTIQPSLESNFEKLLQGQNID